VKSFYYVNKFNVKQFINFNFNNEQRIIKQKQSKKLVLKSEKTTLSNTITTVINTNKLPSKREKDKKKNLDKNVKNDKKSLISNIVTMILDKLENEIDLELLDEDSINEAFSDLNNKDDDESSRNELLNGVVRIYCTHSEPNFAIPWQRQKQEFSTSSGFVIEGF
jgi:hypothetical protein